MRQIEAIEFVIEILSTKNRSEMLVKLDNSEEVKALKKLGYSYSMNYVSENGHCYVITYTKKGGKS